MVDIKVIAHRGIALLTRNSFFVTFAVKRIRNETDQHVHTTPRGLKLEEFFDFFSFVFQQKNKRVLLSFPVYPQ